MERVPWDDIVEARHTREGNHPRVQVLLRDDTVIDIDDLRAPSRGRKRLVAAITAGLADPAARPTGEAVARTVPAFLISLAPTAVVATMILWSLLR